MNTASQESNFLTNIIEKNKKIDKQLRKSGIDLSMLQMLNRKLIIEANDAIIRYVCGWFLPNKMSFDNDKIKRYFNSAHEELYNNASNSKGLNVMSSLATLSWFLPEIHKNEYDVLKKMLKNLSAARNAVAHSDGFLAGFTTLDETEKSLNDIVIEIEKIIRLILEG